MAIQHAIPNAYMRLRYSLRMWLGRPSCVERIAAERNALLRRVHEYMEEFESMKAAGYPVTYIVAQFDFGEYVRATPGYLQISARDPVALALATSIWACPPRATAQAADADHCAAPRPADAPPASGEA